MFHTPPEATFKELINTTHGVSTCCRYCKAGYVDIANIKKTMNSNNLLVEFDCNRGCGKANEFWFDIRTWKTIV